MKSSKSEVDQILCPDGHPNPSTAKFCGICGKRLERPPPEPEVIEPILVPGRREFSFLGVGNTGYSIVSNLSRLVPPELKTFSFLIFDTDLPREAEMSEREGYSAFKVGIHSQGTGHLWKVGERIVAEDLAIREIIKQPSFSDTEAIFLICSLGGGMGGGAGPYLLGMLPDWGIRAPRLALAVLPAESESDQLQFNAYCGLSRLLKYRLKQNCDFLILVSNSNLEYYRAVDRSGRELDRQEILAMVLHMLVSSGDAGSYRRITASDLTTYERATRVVHFSPCLALGHSMKIYGGLTGVLESAFERPLSSFDKDSALFTYLTLRISKSLKMKMQYQDLSSQFDRWRRQNLPSSYISYFALSYTSDLTDKMDLLLLVGGYPLEPSLTSLKEGYRRVKESSTVSPSELQTIEDTYKEYDYNLKTVYQSIRKGRHL